MNIKVTTFNAEWMYSFFAKGKAKILNTFPGGKLGVIKLEPIENVKILCKRIGRMFDSIDSDVIAIVEGPQMKIQMELFVKQYMHDEYNVFTQSKVTQNIHILVRKSFNNLKQFDYEGPKLEILRNWFYYYPWGKYTEAECKKSRIARVPVAIELIINNKSIIFVAVHTKSKISKLKRFNQWLERDKKAILDALNARQKLSAEIRRIRDFLTDELKRSGINQPLVIMGDFNDGLFSELMEQEFLIHNIIDEIQGSLLEPELRLFHSMSTETLRTSYSTRFKDPFNENQIVNELIDHILISRGIAEKTSGVSIAPNSAKVEYSAYNDNNDETEGNRARGLRPSDHIPVSAILIV